MSRIAAALVALGCVLAVAQQPEAPKPPAEPAPAPTAPETPPKPVLTYQGKPLRVNVTCSEEDMTSFGLTCTPEHPCDIYLELVGVEAVGSKLFLTGNLHTDAVTMWSVLLQSTDAGKTWTEEQERMRSTGLEHIQFIDFEVGWVSGQTLLALPRDPFLLITNDGGKTWRKRPVSNEPRVGAVEQFAFENRNNGALLIDRTQSGDAGGRHEFYESSTGGDSWMMREVGPRPIKLKKPRIPNPDLRLRADAPSKSFRIERRAGQRWETVSAFLVQSGECRPAELKFAEPPPEPEPKVEDTPVLVVPRSGPPRLQKKAPTLKKK